MPPFETACHNERPRYARYAAALWVPIRVVVILAGLCWLGLNVAVFTGLYMRTADPLSIFTIDFESFTSSSSNSSSSSSSSSSSGSKEKDKSHLLYSSDTDGEHAFLKEEDAAHSHINDYAAIGKIKPSENGEYIGAAANRMHGLLGLYPDGAPAYIPTSPPDQDMPIEEVLRRGGGFNILLSDSLSLDREAVDARRSHCRWQRYNINKLPKASVIIIFFNEPFSTLLRSVHSVLNSTPPQLLEEIILVDDGSTLDYIASESSRGPGRNAAAAAATAAAVAKTGGSGDVESVGDKVSSSLRSAAAGEAAAAAARQHEDKVSVDNESKEQDEKEGGVVSSALHRPMQSQQQQQQRKNSVIGSSNYRSSPTLVEYIDLLPMKVKLLRNKERMGIVGARMHGIRAAIAPVFVILDSHIEVQPQWLEPLLYRIAGDRRRIVMPQIDGIEADTFEYTGGGIGCKLGFLWKLMEHSYEPHQLARSNEFSSPAKEYISTMNRGGGIIPAAASSAEDNMYTEDGEILLRRRIDPTIVAGAGAPGGGGGDAEISPVMAGGLFAADKKFFFEIGAYDEAFQYWGTENLELSFRLWQCGGILECAPCSRVYHIFRKGGGGYNLPPSALTVNKMRTLLWMDQYADLSWRVLGKPRINFGYDSLQERRKWREAKKCKSFKWFLHTIFPEADVLDIEDVPYLGPLENKGSRACLGVMGYPSPGSNTSLQPCGSIENQDFMYFRKVGHIMPVRDDEACLEVSGRLDWCRGEPKHEWQFTATGLLLHPQTQKCLSGYGNALHAVPCDDTDGFQVWSWTPYNPKEKFEFPLPPSMRGV